ncbi:hypothetical protein NQZ68_033989 [Dissostichus eleginoides]|nr:hypothetical protein NQZ68_033989 [Dissostichus eleginoides]
MMFMQFDQKQSDEKCMWSTARGRQADTHLPAEEDDGRLFEDEGERFLTRWTIEQPRGSMLGFCCPLLGHPMALIEALSLNVSPR